MLTLDGDRTGGTLSRVEMANLHQTAELLYLGEKGGAFLRIRDVSIREERGRVNLASKYYKKEV